MPSSTAFELGQQPCGNFTPRMGYYGHNEHECFAFGPRKKDPEAECRATVSFCENCHSDHHAFGYENCCRAATWDEYRAILLQNASDDKENSGA